MYAVIILSHKEADELEAQRTCWRSNSTIQQEVKRGYLRPYGGSPIMARKSSTVDLPQNIGKPEREILAPTILMSPS